MPSPASFYPTETPETSPEVEPPGVELGEGLVWIVEELARVGFVVEVDGEPRSPEALEDMGRDYGARPERWSVCVRRATPPEASAAWERRASEEAAPPPEPRCPSCGGDTHVAVDGDRRWRDCTHGCGPVGETW